MKMWQGRFSKPSAALMDSFNRSLPVDAALLQDDIAGSIAWARALHKAGVLSKKECAAICRGLRGILSDHGRAGLAFLPADEDVHMAVERMLVERIGEAGSRLHTGRSRNDQVSTDFRMYIKRSLRGITDHILTLQKSLLERAKAEQDVIIPGYTHLQQAQPVVLSHYWLSFFFALQREKLRCTHAIQSADSLVLGSGAVAGSGFAVDRQALARELGFGRISENSMDGVGSRDFALETLAAIASLGTLLSRYAEDGIIWSSQEFCFIELDEAWSTGSSMMPQKKNPDSLELIRGKCGRFIGNYTRFAVTLKGLGLTYYKDLQEDKEPVIDSIQQMAAVLEVFCGVIQTLRVNRKVIERKLDPFLLATDIADYLVDRGLPFRKAHAVVGEIVRYCIKEGRRIDGLTVQKMREFCNLFDDDVTKVFQWEHALIRRSVEGGTGPSSIKKQIKTAEALVRKSRGR